MSFKWSEYEKEREEKELEIYSGPRRRIPNKKFVQIESDEDEEETPPVQLNSENLCVQCDKPVGTVHACPQCKQYIHLICGTPVGEEGFGQSVICSKCKIKYSENEKSSNSSCFSSYAIFYNGTTK